MDDIEISEIKECITSNILDHPEYKCYSLRPIIGEWKFCRIYWYQDSKCFECIDNYIKTEFGFNIVYINVPYYAGTDFDKVCGK
jgi:hypothetical protein